MKVIASFLCTILVCFAIGGCGEAPPEKAKGQNKEERIQTALAKLSPEDRKSAEEQKFCAVEKKKRLGSMGTPVKINEKPVFLCCEGCEDAAKKDKEATLKAVEDLKAAKN